MKPARKSAVPKDYFGTFLETVKTVQVDDGAGRAAEQAAVPDRPGRTAPGAGTPAPPTVQHVLRLLRDEGDRSVADLATALGAPIIPTAEMLDKLQASNLVAVEGEPGRELVRLTEAGRNLAELG